MIVIEPCAGLSNRILALATAYYLAEKHGHGIKVLWDIDGAVGADIRTLFELPEDMPIVITTKKGFFRAPYLWCKSKAVRAYLDRKYDAFLDCGDIMQSLKGDKSIDFAELLQKNELIYIKSFCELERIRDKNIFSIFKASQEVLKRGAAVFERIGSMTYGMHIRRTDHEEAIRNSPTELFIEKAEEILKHSDKTNIFLATDDEELALFMEERFEKRVFSYQEKVFTRLDKQGMQDGLIDMLALSKCVKIYGSYGSTFGLMASYIGNKEFTILKKDCEYGKTGEAAYHGDYTGI